MTPPLHASRVLRLVPLLLAGLLSGCGVNQAAPVDRRSDPVAQSADLILAMAPDADWTEHYNRLAAAPGVALQHILTRPAMVNPPCADALDTLLCTSLAALLSQEAEPPQLTLYAFETSSDLLHLAPKVAGRELGEICVEPGRPPLRWQDLYRGRFDRAAAARVDLEADRTAMLSWWRSQNRVWEAQVWVTRPLRPQPDRLFRLLSRRHADLWVYQPDFGAAQLVSDPPDAGLFSVSTVDYNLVRAAGIQLGSSADLDVTERLVRLMGDGSPVVAHNARFALGFHPNARIRAAVRRSRPEPAPETLRWAL